MQVYTTCPLMLSVLEVFFSDFCMSIVFCLLLKEWIKSEEKFDRNFLGDNM
jgi:hypothetical protein